LLKSPWSLARLLFTKQNRTSQHFFIQFHNSKVLSLISTKLLNDCGFAATPPSKTKRKKQTTTAAAALQHLRNMYQWSLSPNSIVHLKTESCNPSLFFQATTGAPP
jgi:hypothetical protein